MSQSLSYLLIHVVFSTRKRVPNINTSVRARLHAYLAQTVREIDNTSECFGCGGVEDHVHLALRLGRTMALADMTRQIKACSSKWLKVQSHELLDFSWQNGYGAFSLRPSDLQPLLRYINNQSEHHRKITFQDEFRELLRRNEIPFDESHVWG